MKNTSSHKCRNLLIPQLLSFVIAILVFLAIPAAAITVTNTSDGGAGSLRQAIADAAPGDTINFTVTGTITLTSGQLVINKNLTIQGPGASLLSISGNHASRVFLISAGVTAALDGLTIKDGEVPVDGGGIYNEGTLTLSNSSITGNATTEDLTHGGGIFNGGTLNLNESTVSGNVAGNADGFSSGGGISNGGVMNIMDSTVSENTSDAGGGITNYGSMTAINSTISRNAVDGIFNFGTLTVSNGTVSENSYGNGIYIFDFGVLTVTNSTISGNSGWPGTDYGGGINAIRNGAGVTIKNTIVAGNTLSGSPADIQGTIGTASHNLIADAATSGGILNGVNSNIVGVNSLLGPLRNNGGPTKTHALRPGSPAINAGDNCVLTENGCGFTHPALPTDQRGMPRNGTVDIGAFEAQSGPSPTPTPDPGARTNFALASNGGVASASSEYSGAFPAAGTNNGDRKGLNWGSGGGWNDATSGAYPDMLEIAFDGIKTIDEIDMFTVQDNYASPVDPTESSTFTAYGITGFDVQYWNGSGWVTVENGSVANNNKVWTKLTFSPVETAKIRVVVNGSLSSYSRVVELEAWGGSDDGTPPPPRTNFALTSKGGVALASSVYSNAFPVTGTNNGDRNGLNWGSGGGWNDATAGTYPDLLQIDFDGAKTIDEIDVFTVQDSYWSPSPPTADMTFSQYGVTEFDIQYWSGSDWVTVPGGSISGNNKVWTKVTFPSITTGKIRVQVNNSLSAYSRIVEVEAWGGGSEPPPPTTNFALASNGGVASASSEYSSAFPVAGANNGDRKGLNWGAGGGWNDATAGTYPDFLQIDFNGSKTIDEIDVFTVQDNFSSPLEPTLADTFTQYGITAFDVQYWNGSAWVTVPGGSVTGNNKVWTQVTFSPITTDKIRVQVNNSLASYSRIVEIEAWGGGG